MGLARRLEKLRRTARYLAGYLDFQRPGPSARAADFGHAHRPLLLLHGFLSNRRAVEVLEKRLGKAGYTVFTFDFGGPGRLLRFGIDEMADFVRAKVERLYGRHPAMGPLTIVGHSQGGLVGAYYVKKLGGWRHVRALVTMATPHRGTAAALAGLPLAAVAPSIAQMLPRSRFLSRLARGAWPPGVRLTSIWSRSDLVSPYPSGVVNGFGLCYVRNLEVAGTAHREFLFAKAVYRVLLAELREAEEAAPVPLPHQRAAPAGERAAG